MTSLEDTILYGKPTGYCSSSSDEGEDPSNAESSKVKDGSRSTEHKNIRNTGPKGVLQDWKEYKFLKAREFECKERELIKLAKKGTLHNDIDEDELDTIRRMRRKELCEIAVGSGKVRELETKEAFLTSIENCRNTFLFIHIYEKEVEGCKVLNNVLCSIAARYPSSHFVRIKSSVLNTSSAFSSKGLPTLQVYYNEALVGNFVRLTETLGEDFNADLLVRYLLSHEIDLDAQIGGGRTLGNDDSSSSSSEDCLSMLPKSGQ
ncbi:hypothetical protein AB6A40_001729 [Gnathostoma spinigerum]|uniref:Phosducin domain-containing protein n=1 Tax=Gnathostoma spinigerum TaxID=75299 RepID=A0ABD6E4V2_9BILA